MKLELMGTETNCADRTCPAIYRTDRNSFVMQGKFLSDDVISQLKLADDETAVEVPADVVEQLLARLK